MNKKENSGYRQTHQKIKEYLLEELNAKSSLNKIKVGALCKMSGVSRSTFYAHFQDIYDVMEQLQNDKNMELVELYKEVDFSRGPAIARQCLEVLTQYLYDNKDFYRAMLVDKSNRMMERSQDMAMEQIMKPIYQKIGLTERECEYYFLFVWDGTQAVLRKWVEDDMVESPHEIAGIISRSMPGISEEEMKYLC